MPSSKFISVLINTKRRHQCMKCITWGSIMLLVTLYVLMIYVDDLHVTINNVATNFENKCEITSIQIMSHTFNCWSSDRASVVDLPCVKILLKTDSLFNITFYRNIHEKKFVDDNNVNCSYVPTACQNDALYMNQYLKDNLDKLFPKPNISFPCYLIKNNTAGHSAFMYLPDPIIYYTSITVISFGICISFAIIIYGLSYLNLFHHVVKVFFKSKIADKKILKSRKQEQAEITKGQTEDTDVYIKRVLDDLNRGLFKPNSCDQLLFKRQNSDINVGRISSYNLSSPRKSSIFYNDLISSRESVRFDQIDELDGNNDLVTVVEDQGLIIENKRF